MLNPKASSDACAAGTCSSGIDLQLGPLLEQSGFESLVFDAGDFRLLQCSQALLSNTGFEIDELRAKTILDLHVDLTLDRLARDLLELSEHRRETVVIKSRHRRKNGSSYPVEAHIKRVEDGRNARFVSVVIDATSRSVREDASTRSEQESSGMQRMVTLGQLTAGIAHDLNNILTPALGYAEIATGAVQIGDPVKADLDNIVESINYAGQLTRQILKFAGRDRDAFAPVQLSEIVRGSLRLLGGHLPTSIQVKTELDEVWVTGSPTQLQQIVINLGMNAASAMSNGGGVIEISISKVDDTETIAERHPILNARSLVRLRVRDEGTGIATHDLERIFDPLYTTDQRGEGMGLGLFVIKRIVDNHLGAIDVISDPGFGTTFDLYFPAAVHSTASKELNQGDSRRPNCGRIPLVDDSPAIARRITRSIEPEGYEPDTATSSKHALDRKEGALRDRER